MKRVIAAALFGLAGLGPVAAQNLIPDPTFSSGVSAWTVRDASSSTLTWNPSAGADGAPGFAQLHPLLGLTTSFATICLPVEPAATYSFGGLFRVHQREATSYVTIRFLPEGSCGGPGSLLDVQTPPLNGSSANLGVWYLRQGPDTVAPAGAMSVDLEVVSISGPNAVTLDFDDMFFGRQGTGPPMESVSVPMLSSSALVLLALMLAGVSVIRLTRR